MEDYEDYVEAMKKMISTIVLGEIFVIAVLAAIFGWRESEQVHATLGTIIAVACPLLLTLFLCKGYCKKVSEDTLIDREAIILAYENNPCERNLNKARERESITVI